MSPNAWHLFALFIGTIAAIIGKAMPLGALSVIAIALVALTQVTNPGKPAAALTDALSGFANPLIWLIVLAVMVALSLNKTGLGKRIGYYFIMLLGKKTIGVAYGLVASELVIAPVTPSNTARGGGVIHPIMRSIADSYGSSPEKGTSSGSAAIWRWSTTTPTRSPRPCSSPRPRPIPLCVELIAKATNSSIQITWGQWALAALLPCLVMLLVMPLVLYLLYPPEIKQTPGAKELARDELAKLGPMKPEEKITLGVLVLMLVDLGRHSGLDSWARLSPSTRPTTAVIGLSLLLITGVLEWEDILKARSAWDTLMWFAALVMMATFLGRLGLTKWFSETIQGGITEMGLDWKASRRPPGAGLFLRPLLLRQHDGARHRHVRGLLRRRHRARRAAHAARPAAGLLVLAEHVVDPLRDRHRADHFRLGLRHPERMVDRRLRHERGQHRYWSWSAAFGGRCSATSCANG